MPTYPTSPAYPVWPKLISAAFDAGHLVTDQNGLFTVGFYQMADYDPVHDLCLFYPYSSDIAMYGTGVGPGSVAGIGLPFATLLVYDCTKDFYDVTAWTAIDLTSAGVGGSALSHGFGGGFMDSGHSYAFLPALEQVSQGLAISSTFTAGSGYVDGTWSLTIGAPTGAQARQATATVTVSGGHITGATVTKIGSGYTSTPTYAFPAGMTATGGTGGALTLGTQGVWASNSLTARVKLSTLKSAPLASTTYDFLDLSFLGLGSNIGSFYGAYCNGATYYCPTSNQTDFTTSVNVIRCTAPTGSSAQFATHANWESFDVSQIHTGIAGSQSTAVVGTNLYLLPYGSGGSTIACFDTTGAAGTGGHSSIFTNPANWTFFDLSALTGSSQIGGARSMTGGLLIDNRYLLMIPWKDLSLDNTTHTITTPLLYASVLYDTTLPIGSASSYKVFDAIKVSNGIGQFAAGFEFGWQDKLGICYFIPTGIYNQQSHQCCPIIAFNPHYNGGTAWSNFTNPLAWTAYQDPLFDPTNPGAVNTAYWVPSCGGPAYDPVRECAYFVGLGASQAPNINHSSTNFRNHGAIMRISHLR